MMNKQELMKNIKLLAREASQQWPHEEMVELRDVLREINQLDEPEVLSQEWIDDNKEMYLINDTSENAVPDYKLRNLLVPKQELPVIPKYVADWFEGNKEHFEDRLKSAIKYREINDDPSEFDVWLDNPHNKPLQTLGNMFNGYEVEEEQKYYVLNASGSAILRRNTDKEYNSKIAYAESGRLMKNIVAHEEEHLYQFTEKEIKDYDERFWPFAEPIE